jgi:phosphoserine phosphatase
VAFDRCFGLEDFFFLRQPKAERDNAMIVVTDLIGTLTTGSPIRGLVSWVKHNQSELRANLFIASIMPSFFLATVGLTNWQKWSQGLMIRALPLIREATKEKIRQMSTWTVERKLWPNRREDVLARIDRQVKEGAQVYIVSSVYEPTVEAFAARLGVQAIGTPVEIVKGRARFAQELVTNERKVEQVLSRVGVDRVDVAYGDTWNDIPLLERADHPVAVYPDDRLRATALKSGWEIVGIRES